jgi:DNA-binding transcriptional ArsR family regulator
VKDGPNIARVAAAIGEPARAEMLAALMAGQALTATELAGVAGVGKTTASAHLSRLLDSRLVAVEAQGRYRYFRLADADVARLLETLMGVAVRTGAVRVRAGPREPALRHARVCYDHLAGDVGVGIFDGLLQRRLLRARDDALEVTRAGRDTFAAFGIDVDALRTGRRPLCRRCLDWSARRPHLGGALGAALLQRFTSQGWARRAKDSRAVLLSPKGEVLLRERLLPSP